MNVPNVITRWNRIAKMKKTILTAIALLCLSTPLQAFDYPCFILDVPCYVKSNTTILREKPSEDSQIVQQLSPARDSDRLYYYLRVRRAVKRKWWGYFEPVEPIVDMITGKTMAGGWAPLANAFHDVDKTTSVFNEPEKNIVMDIWFFEPNKFSVFVMSVSDAYLYLPLRPENIVQK